MEILKFEKKHFDEAMLSYQDGIDSEICTFNTKVPTYEDWDKAHLPFGRFVASLNGRIIGFCCLSYFSSASFYNGVLEDTIYVKNEFKSIGAGRELMNALIKDSEDNNAWTIVAHIMADNKASISFHEAMGFRFVGYREKLGKNKKGIWLDTVLMEKRSKIIY